MRIATRFCRVFLRRLSVRDCLSSWLCHLTCQKRAPWGHYKIEPERGESKGVVSFQCILLAKKKKTRAFLSFSVLSPERAHALSFSPLCQIFLNFNIAFLYFIIVAFYSCLNYNWKHSARLFVWKRWNALQWTRTQQLPALKSPGARTSRHDRVKIIKKKN